MVPAHRAEAHRHVGRAIGRGADLRDRAAGHLGEDRQPRHVGHLALIGRHAERGVALQVLDRAEAFLIGERDILRRDVVLEIHEGLRAAVLDVPQRRDGGRLVAGRRLHKRRHPESAFDREHRTGGEPFLQAIGKLHRAFRGTRHMHAGRHRAGHESRKRFVPDRLAVEVTGQVHGRIPAARHGERIAGDFRRAAARIDHVDRLDAQRAVHMRDCAPVIAFTPSAENWPGGSARESIMAAISIPAARASAAVRQPSSLLVKTARRCPGTAA